MRSGKIRAGWAASTITATRAAAPSRRAACSTTHVPPRDSTRAIATRAGPLPGSRARAATDSTALGGRPAGVGQVGQPPVDAGGAGLDVALCGEDDQARRVRALRAGRLPDEQGAPHGGREVRGDSAE
jgi:hypothetical protein